MDTRSPSKCKFSDFRMLARKLTKFLTSFFKPRVSFPLNFASIFSVKTIIPPTFYSWNICFGQKKRMKKQFFRLLSALMKVRPIPHAIFETTRPGFIQILFSVMKDNFCIFVAQTLYTLNKKSPPKRNFQTFWVLGWKFTKFLLPYMKPQVNFS